MDTLQSGPAASHHLTSSTPRIEIVAGTGYQGFGIKDLVEPDYRRYACQRTLSLGPLCAGIAGTRQRHPIPSLRWRRLGAPRRDCHLAGRTPGVCFRLRNTGAYNNKSMPAPAFPASSTPSLLPCASHGHCVTLWYLL